MSHQRRVGNLFDEIPLKKHLARWWCCGHGGAVWRHHIVDGYGALHQSKGLVGLAGIVVHSHHQPWPPSIQKRTYHRLLFDGTQARFSKMMLPIGDLHVCSTSLLNLQNIVNKIFVYQIIASCFGGLLMNLSYLRLHITDITSCLMHNCEV
uniref:Uncharacterized protein n=1 Tax=Setaria viridis TaxID=4556 RepID=A0A4U6WB09_SETVI|nr:hypothetical protein SEVIR_1G211700v2 [Setaria viridis]